MNASEPINSKRILNKGRIAKVAAALGLAIVLFVARGYLNKSPLDRAIPIKGAGLPFNPGAIEFWWLSPTRGIYIGYDYGNHWPQTRFVNIDAAAAEPDSKSLGVRLTRNGYLPESLDASPDGTLLLCSWLNPKSLVKSVMTNPPFHIHALVPVSGMSKPLPLDDMLARVWLPDGSGWIEQSLDDMLHEVKLLPGNRLMREKKAGRAYGYVVLVLPNADLVTMDGRYTGPGGRYAGPNDRMEYRFHKFGVDEFEPYGADPAIPWPAEGSYAEAVASPDGHRILWTIEDTERDWRLRLPGWLRNMIGVHRNETWQIWLTNTSGQDRQILGSTANVAREDRPRNFKWSPDSRRISFLRSGKVWIMDVPDP